MPAIHTKASCRIASSSAQVAEKLANFHTWPDWSPWLYIEPEATVEYHGEPGTPGHGYRWEGRRVGSGAMQLTGITEDRIDCDLTFQKPFKSQASVAFELTVPAAGSTAVSWSMQGRLPFFMFWMKPVMEGMIRSDYQRGLALLKDLMEIGSTPSLTRSHGVVDLEATCFVGVQADSAIGDMAETIDSGLKHLVSLLEDRNVSASGSPFVQYTKMDFKRARCHCIISMPIRDAVTGVSGNVVSTELPTCRALKVVHTGAYRHLGNAWSQIMSDQRQQKLKKHASRPPFERYLNDPRTTAEEELITEIYLPVRGG